MNEATAKVVEVSRFSGVSKSLREGESLERAGDRAEVFSGVLASTRVAYQHTAVLVDGIDLFNC